MVTTGIYWSIYALLSKYIYGVGVTLSEDMELTLTILSTLGCLFVVALPFVLVWRVIKIFL